MENNTKKTICNWCNQPTTIIWVHGHGQCANCGTNIEECCRGELCEFHPEEENIKLKPDNDK